MTNFNWDGLQQLPPKSYICGHCGNLVSSSLGYAGGGYARIIYICSHCKKPTYVSENEVIPGPKVGNEVGSLPDDVAYLYEEARSCIASSAYTASVLASRKLLMNVAVSRGAHTGKRFIEYVEYLSDSGYIPPNGKVWVDHIRRKGNEATHEIAIMDAEDATELITFLEMLLKFVYEFPSRVPSDSG